MGASKSIHLRLSKALHEKLEEIKKSLGFSSIQEFIKEITRNAIPKYNKKAKK